MKSMQIIDELISALDIPTPTETNMVGVCDLWQANDDRSVGGQVLRVMKACLHLFRGFQGFKLQHDVLSLNF